MKRAMPLSLGARRIFRDEERTRMKRKFLWLIGIVLLLGAVGVLTYLFRSHTAGEVLDLATKGGFKELREPMRPIRGGTRVLLIALDGVGDDKLREVLRKGRMPRLARILGAEREEGVYESAYAVTDAMSILPSTTMAAWTSVFTGQPVSMTGVSGNEWFVREAQRFYAPGPISVPEYTDTLQMYTEDLLGKSIPVPTLFELVDGRSHVSLAPVFRGADLLTMPAADELAKLFGLVARGLMDAEPVDRKPYAALDKTSVDRLLEAFEKHGVPDLQVAYFPGIDLYTHLAEDPLDELERYLAEIIDPALDRIFEAYASGGLLRDTYIILTSDHGHTPVPKHEHHALGAGAEGEPPDLLEQLGYRVRPFKLRIEKDEEDFDAVFAYQGAIAYIYLADRSTCPNPGDRCAWLAPPRFEEDVMPVVRAFHHANQSGDPFPKLRGTLDLIFTRPPRPVDQPAVPFEIFDGERLVAIGEYLRANPRPDLIQLEDRMNALAAGPYGHRAGDILLLAKSGMNRPLNQRYYFSGLYHSWHGSPERQDSNIPLMLAKAGTPGEELRAIASKVVGDQPSQLHVVPLVKLLLSSQPN
jgi:hypothetical protein